MLDVEGEAELAAAEINMLTVIAPGVSHSGNGSRNGPISSE